MNRSNYTEDADDTWALIRWRGAVASAIRGKRGQAFIKELLGTLEAMPEKKLIEKELEKDGQYCALGCVGAARGIEMRYLDVHNSSLLSKTFGIADALVREIEYINDGDVWVFVNNTFNKDDTPERRWKTVRDWCLEHLKK